MIQTTINAAYRAVYTARLAELTTDDAALADKMRAYKYQIFLSNPPVSAVRNGLLVCGLKPYAVAGRNYTFPAASLAQHYQAYLDETWHTPYVKRALQLIELVQTNMFHTDHNPRNVLITNWFFQRAEDARQLKAMRFKVADQLTWQQQIIDFYQPKVVLCIGNGDAYSAFAGMANLHQLDVKMAEKTDYLERSKLKTLRTGARLIIGVPHLSRYPVNTKMELWLTSLSE